MKNPSYRSLIHPYESKYPQENKPNFKMKNILKLRDVKEN
jgi:hypothetical protein